jgi:hypothetical protein
MKKVLIVLIFFIAVAGWSDQFLDLMADALKMPEATDRLSGFDYLIDN